MLGKKTREMLSKFIFVLLTIWTLYLAEAQQCPPDTGGPTACVFDPKVNCVASKYQCIRGYKCCSQGCNSVCTAVLASNGKHGGSCKRASGARGQTCKKDNQCKAYEKCCGGNCRQVRTPTTPPRQPRKQKS